MMRRNKKRLTTLKLKLGASLAPGVSTKLAHEILEDVATGANRIRNAISRSAEQLYLSNPDYEPQQCKVRDGSPKFDKNGKPVLESRWWPQDFNKEIYHVYKEVCPHIATSIAAACLADVGTKFKSKVPWNYEGSAKIFGEAVLLNEVSRPCFRGLCFAVAHKTAMIGYDGEIRVLPGQFTSEIDAFTKMAESACIVRFPVFGGKEGERRGLSSNYLTFRLEANGGRANGKKPADLTAGHKRILMSVCRGEMEMSDSKVFMGDDGEWYLLLSVRGDSENKHLDAERTVTIYPAPPEHRRPFLVVLPGGRTFGIGDGKQYEMAFNRLSTRSMAIKNHYRTHCTGHGHGRGKVISKVRKVSRGFKGLQAQFIRSLANHIVRICEEHNCGKVVWQDPSMPLRKAVWLGGKGLQCTWDNLESQVKHACGNNSIAVKVERLKFGDWKAALETGVLAKEGAKFKRDKGCDSASEDG